MNDIGGHFIGDIEPIRFAEDTIALQFCDIYGQNMRYVAKWGRWYAWNGSVWLEDDTLSVFDKIRAIVRQEADAATALAKRAGVNKPEAAGRKLLDGRVIASIERLARSDRRVAATTEQWDADPWVLNTPSGIVDLRTGEIADPDPLAYCTRCAAATPAPGEMPMFSAFLHRVTGGDVDFQAYIQRFLGYCLTGLTIEHALFFLYGTGANGKSVLVNTIAAIMADYAKSASIEVFLHTKHEQHATAIANLMGARLVSVVETEKGARWAESKIKQLTGGDTISARFMRQDFFEFVPQFKLMIAGNHKPTIRGVDEAMRRRMNLVPFTVTIPAEERDAELFERMRDEWPQILDWMVTGCLAWQEYRLNPPPCVVNATEIYMEAEDALGQWMNERGDFSNHYFTLAADLYADWKIWCEKNGEFVGTAKAFSQSLEDRNLKRQRESSTGKRGFVGIKLREENLL